jgi:signal transduction histidine kinase/CheY-like chemotaxis protein
MALLRATSIQRKLTVVVMLITTLALLIAAAQFIANDVRDYRGRVVVDLGTLAGVLSHNIISALDFEDAKDAERTLAALQAKPHILGAAVYSKDGKLFASYRPTSATKSFLPAMAPPEGHRFTGGRVELCQPILKGESKVGSIYLDFELVEIWRRVGQNCAVVAAMLGISALIAFVVTTRLQRVISRPILELAQVANAISEKQDYSVRATKHTEDEIGFLIDCFNGMLAQIEKHQKTLSEVNERLAMSERRALAATEAKSQFLAHMSHELRTPLNAIIGYSEMVQEELEELGQTQLLPDLQKIHSAAKHQLGLINDILDLSKIEAGKMSLFLETFDLEATVQDVAATVRPLVAKNSNRLEVDCPTNIGTMRADQTKLRQILFNLLSNATKFTERGTISLRVARDGGVTFVVHDTGIGMSDEQVGRLFQAFTQAADSTTRKYGGTGLGLALSRKFCQLMGGDLKVVSQLGKGSTFTVTLPAVVPDTTRPARAPVPAPGVPASPASARIARSTILVIDDEPAALDLVGRALGKEGYHIQTAASGPEGLALARQLKPAAITLDVMMAGMDGWAVLSALKADPLTNDIPVVMLTVVDDKNLGFALGATDYLIKPIEWERLIAVLDKIQRHRANGRVLVVEDEPESREMLRRAAERQGWQVTEAENGRVGLARLDEQVPDVILLDLMMPEMDGFTFMEELRRRPDTRQVPVIVVTAKDLTEAERRRLNGHVIQIVQKGGYSTRELVEEVDRLLAVVADTAKDI